jgi:hypothetical protein
MKSPVIQIRADRDRPLNAISLTNAVLRVECDIVSDSPHDHCRVCGSRSLFNISRMLGGMLPHERATLVSTARPAAAILPHPVLTFPRPNRGRETPPQTVPVELVFSSRCGAGS